VEWGKGPWRNGRFRVALRSRYRLIDDGRRGPFFLLTMRAGNDANRERRVGFSSRRALDTVHWQLCTATDICARFSI